MAFVFEQVVSRLETYARQRPQRYRWQVAAFAIFGYVAYAAILVFLLAILAFCVALIAVIAWLGISLAIASLVVIWSFLRALWVRLPDRRGLELKPADAPLLFAELRDICERLKGPRIHRVLVDTEHNASLTQIPRLGIFGWQRNVLVLGYVLMASTSAEEFRAIIAHEIGHASGNHGRFGAWIYRVRQSWHAVLNHLPGDSRSGTVWIQLMQLLARTITTSFLLWYVPRLDAYSFALGRLHEYEADQAAADIVSVEVASRALIAMNLRPLAPYWGRVWEASAQTARPPQNAYAGLREWLRSEPSAVGAAARLASLLRAESRNDDVHPCLRQRLIALGCDLSVGPEALVAQLGLDRPLPDNAAEVYLDVAHVEAWAAAEWCKAVQSHWADRYKSIAAARQKLAELDARAGTQHLSDAERLARATCAGTLNDSRELSLWEEVLAAAPELTVATFNIARLRLANGDHSAVEILERCTGNLEFAQAAYATLIAHFSENGNAKEAERYASMRDQYHRTLTLARAERTGFTGADELLPPALSDEYVEGIRKLAREYPRLGRVLIARKKLAYFPQYPYHAVVLIPRRRWYKFYSPKADVDELMPIAKWIKLPGEGRVFLGSNIRYAWLRRKIEKVEGSEIFRCS